MKIKRYIASALACVFCCAVLTSTAAAHVGDFYITKYIERDTANFVLKVYEKKLPNDNDNDNVFTNSNVYSYYTEWNNISSKVKLSMAFAGGGMPTILNQLCVYESDLGGERTEDEYGNVTISITGGKTYFYDREGKRVNPEWFDFISTQIMINNGDVALELYKNDNYGIAAARKAFLHEVGHALLLSHPINGNLPGHSISGYPKSVMNQGYPVEHNYISTTITDHDKSNLIAKWEA